MEITKLGSKHYVINHNKQEWFISYSTIIVYKDENNNTFLDEYYWDYSRTTGKYRNIYLNEKKPETERKIKEGTYKLENLNK